MRKSEMLLGRKPARAQFQQTGEVLLSAYDVLGGAKRFYVECSSEHKPGPGVLYRIRVKAKRKRERRKRK